MLEVLPQVSSHKYTLLSCPNMTRTDQWLSRPLWAPKTKSHDYARFAFPMFPSWELLSACSLHHISSLKRGAYVKFPRSGQHR